MMNKKERSLTTALTTSLPEREYLRTRTIEWLDKNVQIKVQGITKSTSGVGVQRSHSLVHEIGV